MWVYWPCSESGPDSVKMQPASVLAGDAHVMRTTLFSTTSSHVVPDLGTPPIRMWHVLPVAAVSVEVTAAVDGGAATTLTDAPGPSARRPPRCRGCCCMTRGTGGLAFAVARRWLVMVSVVLPISAVQGTSTTPRRCHPSASPVHKAPSTRHQVHQCGVVGPPSFDSAPVYGALSAVAFGIVIRDGRLKLRSELTFAPMPAPAPLGVLGDWSYAMACPCASLGGDTRGDGVPQPPDHGEGVFQPLVLRGVVRGDAVAVAATGPQAGESTAGRRLGDAVVGPSPQLGDCAEGSRIGVKPGGLLKLALKLCIVLLTCVSQGRSCTVLPCRSMPMTAACSTPKHTHVLRARHPWHGCQSEANVFSATFGPQKSPLV